MSGKLGMSRATATLTCRRLRLDARQELHIARDGDGLHLTLFTMGRGGASRPRQTISAPLAVVGALIAAIAEVTSARSRT